MHTTFPHVKRVGGTKNTQGKHNEQQASFVKNIAGSCEVCFPVLKKALWCISLSATPTEHFPSLQANSLRTQVKICSSSLPARYPTGQIPPLEMC